MVGITAETARKQLRALFTFAVKLQWRADNPMDHVSYRAKKTAGFHSWTESEIEQYRATWAMGTKQRLAMELGLWTGKRRNDAVRMGPQHMEGGHLIGRDSKTDKPWSRQRLTSPTCSGAQPHDRPRASLVRLLAPGPYGGAGGCQKNRGNRDDD